MTPVVHLSESLLPEKQLLKLDETSPGIPLVDALHPSKSLIQHVIGSPENFSLLQVTPLPLLEQQLLQHPLEFTAL